MRSFFCLLTATLTFLTAAASAIKHHPSSPSPDPSIKPGALSLITADIHNPTNVTFYLYVPTHLPPNPPILVSPHWCHGSALAVYNYSSFATLAEQHGFLVLYPDSPNTTGKCWDVSSRATLSHYPSVGPGQEGGDSLGIVNMAQWVIRTFGADAGRVFVTGVSSGAMMTEVLLGAYPDVFAAGTAFAGVPFGCFASSVPGEVDVRDYWSDDCAKGRVKKTKEEWTGVVKGAWEGYEGWRPKVQIFHGTEDEVLDYMNFGEAVKQWTGVLGLEDGGRGVVVTEDVLFKGWTRYAYGGKGKGEEVWFEAYSAKGVTHDIGNHEDVAVEWFDLKCKEREKCFRWGRGGPLGGSLRNATVVVV